jgi:hypothetical protein
VLINHIIAERISSKLTLTENINQQNGHASVRLGGSASLRGGRIQISVQHSIQFVQGAGYQKTTSVSVHLRLRDLLFTGETVVAPFGKTRFLGSAETYLQTDLLPAANHEKRAATGKYLIKALCLEGTTPLEGCTVRVAGKTMAFSNARGEIEIRVRKNVPVQLEILVDEFSGPGSYQLLSAPDQAAVGTPIRIIVTEKR